MNEVIDTILNLSVFVFIGVLIWLYQKPAAGEDALSKESNDEHPS
jgi:hypothetical protein